MNNDYITVGIDIDTAENITAKVLEHQFWSLDLNGDKCPLFTWEVEENERLTEELRQAFIKVLEYNGVYITKKRGKYVRRAKG